MTLETIDHAQVAMPAGEEDKARAFYERLLGLPEQPKPPRMSMLEFIKTLPPGPRAFPSWEEYERHLREEKDAWER